MKKNAHFFGKALLTLTAISSATTNIIYTFVPYFVLNMEQERGYLHRYAMLFGTYMGVYWILKFILLPLSQSVPFFETLFVILTLLVPFMGYFYVRMYRDQVCGGSIGFVHAWVFTVFMYLFAALLTTVAHYIYFQYLDNGNLLQFVLEKIDKEKLRAPQELHEQWDLYAELYSTILTQTPIKIVVNFLSGNVIGGSLLGIPTALFAMRKRKKE